MEFIARHINDEDVFDYYWLTSGVADGEIVGGDLSVNGTDIDNLDFYLKDEEFADLMDVFVRMMREARKSGLYCDGIVSKAS